MSEELLDRLRATALAAAPEPGAALETAEVVTRGRTLRRRRGVLAAMGGAAVLAGVVALGAPALANLGTAPLGPADRSSAGVRASGPAATSAAPAAVALGAHYLAATGVAATSGEVSPLPGNRLTLSVDHGGDQLEVTTHDADGRPTSSVGYTFEPGSREVYEIVGPASDEPDGSRLTVGVVGADVESPRAVLVTGDAAFEVPLFQVPGSDRWFYVLLRDADAPDGQQVVIRGADGTFTSDNCTPRCTGDVPEALRSRVEHLLG